LLAVFVQHLGGMDLRSLEQSLGYTALVVSDERRPNNDGNQKETPKALAFMSLDMVCGDLPRRGDPG
jgi:hypothetical protein